MRQLLTALLFSIIPVGVSAQAQPGGAQAEANTAQIETSEEASKLATLRALDKITARITEITIPLDQEYRFGTLALTVTYCRTRPPIEPPETYAYLVIDDIKRNGDRDRVFDGWMLASSPALNALEHPIYDVWVMTCSASEPES